MTDARQHAPATQRNRDPILRVLQDVLPVAGTVLEISSGTGEHAVYFAPRLSPRPWVPSDPNPLALASISAWRDRYPAPNLHPPLALDVAEPQWWTQLASETLEAHPICAIVNINMIHIAPWAACLGLLAGAEQLLPTGGMLYLYGPFRQRDRPTAASNEAFDASLQAQNPAWGLRYLEDVIAIAAQHQLVLFDVREMPANNLSVVFRQK